MEKNLQNLISCIEGKSVVGNADRMIADVVCDSRAVSAGALFVAVRLHP